MKILLILRHGDSVLGTHENDKERSLSKEGEKEIKSLRKQQPDLFKSIDLVLCSSSTRTKETLDCLVKGLPDRITVCYIDALYHASPETITEEVGLVDDKFNTVLVIGHNPGLTTLLSQVCERQELRVDKSMRTGEMAEFALHKESWQGFRNTDLKFSRLLSPKK